MINIPEKKKEIVIVLLVAVLIISTAVFFYSRSSDSEDNGLNGVDRTVRFPEDEGQHNEPFESWELSLSLDSENGNYKLFMRVVEADFQDGSRIEYMLVDEDEVSGERYYTHKTTEGALTAETDMMDMNVWDNVTETSLYSTEDFVYTIESDLISGIELNLEMRDTKEPTRIGEDGKLYHVEMGTIFGYYQSNLQIEGNIELPDGTSETVNGKGWLEHLWSGETKGLNTETWKIKLDNSVDIFVSNLYDPQSEEHYPNDLFISAVNKIDQSGDLTVYHLGDDTHMENTDYKIIPADISEERCWSYGWNLKSEDFDLTITPAQDNQLHSFNWLGFSHVEGTYLGSYVEGYALTELNYLYHSVPQFEDIWDTYSDDTPRSAVDVYTNITYIPPISIEEIQLNYRINGGEWVERDMEVDDGSWTATIHSQPAETEVEYKLVMIDEAGKIVESDIYDYTVGS
ncbi:MAG: lipocalin-like domain-containing protein [Thermoplasmatota archaeon]